MKPSELLKQTGWTQGTYARDSNGYPIDPYENAACYCAIGAIRRCYGMADGCIGRAIAGVLSDYLELRGVNAYIHAWNDDPERTAEEVIMAFEAINQ